MKPRGPANQTMALLILITALVLPLHGQDVVTSQKTPPARNTSDRNEANSLEVSESDQQTKAKLSSVKQGSNSSFTFPTKRVRFNRYVSSTVGPFSFARTSISAGVDQWRGDPVEWGQGTAGYGKRLASGLGRIAIQQTVTYGLDQALGQDTGFERSTRKGFWPRMTDALAQNITSRTKTGKRVISVPRLAGVYAGGIIPAETWYPSRYTYRDGLRSGTRSLITGFGINVVREFVFRR